MAFGLSTRLLIAASAAVAMSGADAWLAPIEVKGTKMFNSETGEEFRMKGVAYYPRPNGGELAGVTGYDWAADEHESVWGPHLETLKELGANTIRLYAVDPTKPHDKFMCAASEAGIYVIVGMAAPCENCAVPALPPPTCYPPELLTRVQQIYNAFAVYDNTLAFSVGNENNMPTPTDKTGQETAPCVKALLRDTKNYAAACSTSLRHIPIGLDQADLLPRQKWISYYDCVVDGDINTSADWQGFNPYVECDPIKHQTYAQSSGLQQLMTEYKQTNYSRPIMFGEFGCNIGANTIDGFENQRAFKDAKWMNEEPQMTEEIIGGNVFEFSTEVANLAVKKLSPAKDVGKYGIGYFQPDKCDHASTPCKFVPYPEFENLKEAYTTTKPSTLTADTYTKTRDRTLVCPAGMVSELPKTPDVPGLTCASAQPVCGGKTSNAGKKQRFVDDRLLPDGSKPVIKEPVTNPPPKSESASGSAGGSETKSPSSSSGSGAPSPTSAADAIPRVAAISSVVALLALGNAL